MVRGFQFRFYPTPEQKIALARTFGCARFVYNWALNLRSVAWKERKESLNYNVTSAALTKLKQQPEVKWLNEVSAVPVQQSFAALANRLRELLAAWCGISPLQEADRSPIRRVPSGRISVETREAQPC